MILSDITSKLEDIDSKVYYGMVDNEVAEDVWNYIVFNRKLLSVTANKTGYSDYYDVHIIRENFIPEGVDLQVIDKMLEIPGMRLTSENGSYTYVMKPNTNVIIEMLTLHFMRARK